MVEFIGKITLKLKSTGNRILIPEQGSLWHTEYLQQIQLYSQNRDVSLLSSLSSPPGLSVLIKTNRSAVCIASPEELLVSVVTI